MTTDKRNDVELELGLPLAEVSDSHSRFDNAEFPLENQQATDSPLAEDDSDLTYEQPRDAHLHMDEIGDACFQIRKTTETCLVPELKAVHSNIQDLQREFHEKIKRDASKEKIIDNLHDELQKYRDNFVKSNLKSVIMDIIKVVDDIRKLVDYYRVTEPSQDDIPKLLSQLAGISTDLEDICLWHGVERFNAENDHFDPTRQKILKQIETQQTEKDKRIAEQLRPGYMWEGRVLRPEMVSVYVCRDTLSESIDFDKRNTDE